MTSIENCSQQEAEQWDQYLENHPEANFYQRYGWKEINEKNFGHECFYQAVKQDGKLIGVFPVVFIKSRIFGKILCSMPFVNFGGICSDSDSITDLLLKESEQLSKRCQANYLEIRSIKKYSDELPGSLHKISMTIDLDSDPDVLWSAFKSKHRTNIRRVYKDNVHVKQGSHELLDSFYNLLSRSWKGLGTPIYRKNYFKHILDTFPDETRIFVAYQNDTPIATAFNGYYKNTVEGMWAGALPEHRSTQVNYVLYWEMIKDACEKGFKHYHLGRSTVDTGAEAFKKKWNAYSKQLYWQYILSNQSDIPQLNVSNPKFEIAIKVWKQLPLPVTTSIGPLLARSIP